MGLKFCTRTHTHGTLTWKPVPITRSTYGCQLSLLDVQMDKGCSVRVGRRQLKFTMCRLANIYQSHYMHMGWYLLSTLRVCRPTAPNIFYTTNSMWAHIYYLRWVSISFTWFYSTLLSLTRYYSVWLGITWYHLTLLGFTWYYLVWLGITWHYSVLLGSWYWSAYDIGQLMVFIGSWCWLANDMG